MIFRRNESATLRPDASSVVEQADRDPRSPAPHRDGGPLTPGGAGHSLAAGVGRRSSGRDVGRPPPPDQRGEEPAVHHSSPRAVPRAVPEGGGCALAGLAGAISVFGLVVVLGWVAIDLVANDDTPVGPSITTTTAAWFLAAVSAVLIVAAGSLLLTVAAVRSARGRDPRPWRPLTAEEWALAVQLASNGSAWPAPDLFAPDELDVDPELADVLRRQHEEEEEGTQW